MTVHMDVDTGVDDALAILMALNLPEIRLVGISTVAGNTSARQAAINTAYLLERVGADLPIHVGEEQTCDDKPVDPARSVHGGDGLGGVVGTWAAPEGRCLPGSVEAILRTAHEYGNQLHLVLTGPVTNLAVALSVDPETIRQIGQIVIMGGSIREGGNVTPAAEFNAKSDPVAMKRVLESGLPVKLVPLDVTHRVRLFSRDLNGNRKLDPAMRNLIANMTQVYRTFHHKTCGIDGCYLHDPLTVAAVIRPDLFSWERMRVTVVTEGDEAGLTVGTKDETSTVKVAMGVDVEKCLALFWEAMANAKCSDEC